MSDLEELEAIKRVKYKYQRCIDSKQFDELAECFTEDATAAYDSGKFSANGREAVLELVPRHVAIGNRVPGQGHGSGPGRRHRQTGHQRDKDKS